MNDPPDRDGARPLRTVRLTRVTEAVPDRAGGARTVRVTEVAADRDGSHQAGTVPAPVSPAAARARRYRARKRGEDVPKRKPGPKPRSVAALSREIDALSRENRRLTAEVAESRKLTPMLGMRRQRFTLALAGQLRAALERSDPARDAPALQEALRDLGAAIGARHDQWPKS
jgi:hypothetical protein